VQPPLCSSMTHLGSPALTCTDSSGTGGVGKRRHENVSYPPLHTPLLSLLPQICGGKRERAPAESLVLPYTSLVFDLYFIRT